jgi:hypothetical protein
VHLEAGPCTSPLVRLRLAMRFRLCLIPQARVACVQPRISNVIGITCPEDGSRASQCDMAFQFPSIHILNDLLEPYAAVLGRVCKRKLQDAAIAIGISVSQDAAT